MTIDLFQLSFSLIQRKDILESFRSVYHIAKLVTIVTIDWKLRDFVLCSLW